MFEHESAYDFMKKTAVCTISTVSHIFKSKVLLQSVHENMDADLFCLITDSPIFPDPIVGETYEHLDILSDELSNKIKKKYTGNKLRWACKSLYLMCLLNRGYEKVIYVDNDIYFFSDANFLFNELDDTSILLTPHHYPIKTDEDQNWLEANYRVGLYNAGFIGASQKGLHALAWWASCCLYNIKKSAWRGLFDDQKYLDVLPIAFDKVKVLSHKGCNIAGWNMERCPRSKEGETAVIDGKWPIVFIHFTPMTFQKIISGEDNLLLDYLEKYKRALLKIKSSFSIQSELKRNWRDYLLYFRHIRWRLTRIFE